MSGKIGFEIDGHIAVITIDRPEKLNAVTPDMAASLVDLARRCNEDDVIRAIVLTGAGEKAFSAGSDIRALDSYTTPWSFRQRQDYCDAGSPHRQAGDRRRQRLCLWRRAGNSDVVRYPHRIPERQLCRSGSQARLDRWRGDGDIPARCRRPVKCGFDADDRRPGRIQRLRCNGGLVSEVLPQADLLARGPARQRRQLQRVPPSQWKPQNSIFLLRPGCPSRTRSPMSATCRTICFATEDAAEGRRAFAEKRSPDFRKK